MKCPVCKSIFKNPIARAGGLKSRRVLTHSQAMAMVRARRKKRENLKKP